MTEENQAVAPETVATDEVVREEEQREDTAQEQEAAEPAEQSEPKKAEPDGPDTDGDKPKSRHQRRKEQMERLRAENAEKAAKLKEAEARLKSFEEESAGQKPPTQDDFSTYEEYQAALSAHHAMQLMDRRQRDSMQREAEAHRKEIQQLEEQRRAELAENWQTQLAEARKRYADFDQVALNNSVPISPQVGEMVAGMDSAADVAYHLGMNPAVARELSRMSPLEAAMELGKIEASLSIPKPKTATNAPDPATPVRGKASADKDWRKMTPEEYDAWRAAGGTPT